MALLCVVFVLVDQIVVHAPEQQLNRTKANQIVMTIALLHKFMIASLRHVVAADKPIRHIPHATFSIPLLGCAGTFRICRHCANTPAANNVSCALMAS